MNKNIKYIGINQRIPYEVLDISIHNYIDDETINKEYVLQYIKEFTTGENRALKSASHIIKILKRNEKLISKFKGILGDVTYSQISSFDKKIFSLCLFCLTYPIAYDLLIALAKGFKVQNLLNRQFIMLKMGAIYGGNRSTILAIDAIIPFLIELDLLKRVKMGLYSLSSKLTSSNIFIAELLVYVDIYLSESKSLLIDDLNYRPWYSFFEVPVFKFDNKSNLIKTTESAVGKGYLKISN